MVGRIPVFDVMPQLAGGAHPAKAAVGEEFPVTATIKYQVDWTCAGACFTGSGSLGQVDGPTSTSAIRVGERQSVVVH